MYAKSLNLPVNLFDLVHGITISLQTCIKIKSESKMPAITLLSLKAPRKNASENVVC